MINVEQMRIKKGGGCCNDPNSSVHSSAASPIKGRPNDDWNDDELWTAHMSNGDEASGSTPKSSCCAFSPFYVCSLSR